LALGASPARAAYDPLESFNRAIFAFNDALLVHVVDPIAEFAYTSLSLGVRKAGANIYNNMTEWEFVLTNLIQGNYTESRVSLEQFVINATLGIGGIYDKAIGMGLVRRETEYSEAVC